MNISAKAYAKPQRSSRPLRFLLPFLLLLTATTLAQLSRVEPPHWYSGMHHNQLQILFYGKNIANFTPAVSPGITITNITRTGNNNYLFVTIDTKNVPAGTLTFTFTNGKKQLTHPYKLLPRKSQSAQRKGFSAADAIYLLMPDRFANGNPDNDTMPGMTEPVNRNHHSGRHGGDIAGIIKNLDYIQNLGMTAIWSTPLCEDNDPQGSYHGYGQSDVYRIDPRFGTNEEYKQLSAELHKRNMKLIMDYVTNHWGKHWTFDDMPTYDWLHQFPGYKQTNYRMTTQFDVNAAPSDAQLCADGWFVKSMPDLNQSNPLMLNYLIQNAIWWIEYADLDGLRVDTYSYNDKTAIAAWTKAIMDEYPNFNIVGEVWMYDQAQMAYWQRNSAIGAIQSYNSYLPSVMDFTLHAALSDALREETATWNQGLIRIYDNFTNDFLYPDINNLLVFAENHDTARFNQLYADPADYKLAMTVIATVRGIPQLYYGSEIGMKGEKSVSDGDIRRDFPGGWPNDPHNAFLASNRTDTENIYHDFTAKLFRWRKNKNVIHSGKTTHYIPENNVYVYFRHSETDRVMVVINNNKIPQKIDLNRFAELLGSATTGYDILSERSHPLKGQLEIPAKSSMILEVK